MERTDFVQYASHIVRRACEFSGKARAEGLLAMQGDIDGPKREHRDIFEYGIGFVADGTHPEVIRGILSSLAAQEADEDMRRLKEMQKEAVLCIQRGDNPGILLRTLISHIDRAESVLAREALADIFRDSPYEGFEAPDKESEEFLEQAAQTLITTAQFSDKARKEGLAALEKDLNSLDEGFLKEGLRLVVDGTEAGIIDRILSKRITLEQENEQQRLNAMQKEAVLGIQEGKSNRILLPLLLSYLDNGEFEALRKAHDDLFQSLPYMSVETVSRKKKDFLEQVAHAILWLLDFGEKARTEGFSALEEELEDIDSGFLKDGLRLVLDGTDGDIIYRILSNRIAQEADRDARRLKTIQKEAVLSIAAGDNHSILLHLLISHLDNFELEALRKAHPEIFEGVSEKFPCGGLEAPDEEITGFVKRLARIVRRACEFSDKARAEGLPALKELIDESKAERRDILEYGCQFAADVSEFPVDWLLSNLIAHNCDDETRRLKLIQKEAVLGIQAGENTRVLLHSLLSHIDNSELDALRRTFSYAYISEEFPCGADSETDDEAGKDFAGKLAHIARRACEFSGKASAEGLLALDALINEQKIEHRDIFEYGIQFVVDGHSSEAIQKLLSSLAALEPDPDCRRLKEIQKEAVLCIHGGLHPMEFLHILLSRVTNTELEALRETADDIFALFRYDGTEPAEGTAGETAAPEKSFWILKNLKDALEKSLGSQKAIEITGRLTARLLKEEPPELAKEIKDSIFMFEDILMLEDRSIQRLLREAESQKLVTSLMGVDTLVQNRIYRNMSGRAAAMLKDRIGHKERSGQESAEEGQIRPLETFEDIVLLDDRNIRKLLLELDAEELAKALKNAEPPLQDKIFRNMSKRTAATIKREIENMTGMVNRKHVEESQQKIMTYIRLLESSGEIAARSDDSEIKDARLSIIALIRRLEDTGDINGVGF
ncbi:MAG: hypothetical protein FWB99_09115 [Treponema sp.]|nr:hypothetical protein [Treponema sp.]